MRRASKQLNLSDHFWSSSSIFLSVADLLLVGFLDLEVEGLSFFVFFSETAAGGDEIDPVSLTAPITEMVDGSTKVLSLIGVEELSNFLASCFSFFGLYESVASWAFCSGVQTMQNLHYMSLVFQHMGPSPFLYLCSLRRKNVHHISPWYGHNFLFLFFVQEKTC